MVGLAEQPPAGPQAFPITADAYAVRAEIDLGTVYDRLRKETLRLIEDFSQQGLAGDDLADAVLSGLKDLSDTPIEQAGRGAATEAFNLGRNLAAQASADRIQVVVRTAVLDDDTCSAADRGESIKRCWELDGFKTTVNGPGYFPNMPPSHCRGGDQCRCFYEYLTDESAALHLSQLSLLHEAAGVH